MKGILNLQHNNDEYIMFSNGRNINISDVLYSMYVDNAHIKVKITNTYNNKILFVADGKLYKDKIQPKYYTYHVDKQNIDDVLWNNVGNRLEIEIKNISKN